MLEVLHGQAETICIEEPGVDGAEFCLQRGGKQEYWQAKRHVLNQENWTLNLLKSKGVLDFFLARTREGDACVFASISDAPELRALTENASDATSWEVFRDQFIKSKDRKDDFTSLCVLWGKIPEQEAFEYLKRIRVEGARECTLESFLSRILQVTLMGSPEAALSVLLRLYLSSMHQTLTAKAIQEHLASCHINRREFAAAAALGDFVNGITASYISGQRSKLIRAQSIPRQVASEIVGRLSTSQQSLDVVLIGPAGGGKSGCLLQVAEGLRSAGVPVLAFRLDRLEPVSSPEALGRTLDLPESPAVVLARCFEGRPVVLIVDQLDYVSTTSGRHPGFFDTLAALIDEVRGIRAFHPFHLVLACRQFDFDNDHRFRCLLPKGNNPVLLALLTDVEVREVIRAEGGDPARFSARQLELLRLPQNLSLFVDAHLARERSPNFVSQTALFDKYWEVKRRSASSKRPGESGQWMQVIQTLTDEMSSRQELSVPKTRLDGLSPEFLDVMVSEGVLTFDKGRYGFGHESFFDYCYARSAGAGNKDFVGFLESDDQILFRRAQLRQVLAYLRDSEHTRFLKSVSDALASKRIRPHLKLLVLELIASIEDPSDDEMNLLAPYLERELDCRRRQQPNPDKMATRAFDIFVASRSLFTAADRLGHIQCWLHSGEGWLEDLMISYLRWQAFQHADRVAELLEPFVGKGGGWPGRLRYVMQFGNLEKGRRFFDLFLRLLDDGTLDEACSPLASNGTFWSMLSELPKSQPAWHAELAARWLDRRVKVAVEAGENHGLWLHDEFGATGLFESARLVPMEYLKQVLPAILRAAQAFSFGADNSFLRDRVWLDRCRGEHIGLTESYPSACEEAFKIIAMEDPGLLRPFICELRGKMLYTANHLLFSAYLTAPVYFAEEALALLANEPDRLMCGFSDSALWLSKCLIEQSSAHCSEETFRKLEAVVLNFATPLEKSEKYSHCRGHAAFNLASALPSSRRSPATNERIAEWQRKFSAPDGPPRGIRSYSVVSPVPKDEADNYSDDVWLQAIAKYNADRGVPDWNNPEKGGASEFAGLLQDSLRREPERFARLSLRFPTGTHPSYFMNVLYALKDAPVASSLKCEVVRRIFDSPSRACLTAALDVLGAITDIPLPDDVSQFIKRMAHEHPDPPPERNEDKLRGPWSDIFGGGRNSVRGRAAIAIRDLVTRDRNNLVEFADTIDQLVTDPSLGVRTCVASLLFAVAIHDVPRAFALFARLLDGNDDLLAADTVQKFINAGISNHLAEVGPFIARMLVSPVDEARVAGGAFACLARLFHPSADNLAESALAGDISCRTGAAKVAKDNFVHPDCRDWCESKLKLLFNDKEVEIRKLAANCFWYLWHQPDVPLGQFDSLIRAFLDSPAFADDPTFLLHTLDNTRQRVPEAILDVCDQFVTKCAEQARDVRTAVAADEFTVGRLVFRAYAQLESNALRMRAVTLIDRMCEEGLQSAGKHFADFER
jgi:hypothetical protein